MEAPRPSTMRPLRLDGLVLCLSAMSAGVLAAEAEKILEVKLGETIRRTWDDVKKVPVTDTMTGLNLLKERQLDSTSGATAIAAVQELHSSVGIRALPFVESKEALEKLQELLPGSEIGTIKAGTTPYIT